MTLFSIVIALILEQIQPPPQQRLVLKPLARYALFLEERFNDGQRQHGVIAWLLAVLPGVLLMLVLQVYLAEVNFLLSLALGIAVVYLTMGFRQFSHYFTDIHLALRMGELERARVLLGEWRGRSVERLSTSEVARLAIEQALVAAYRHVFAPLFCFFLLGPAGAVLYRLALFFSTQWGQPGQGAFGEFPRRALYVIDWLPLRLSAATFAMVGDFEDAVFCWRNQATKWPDQDIGILLASGAGALGVRLGLPVDDGSAIGDRPELGLGADADVDCLQSTIGLVWRTTIMFLMLLGFFWIASWVG